MGKLNIENKVRIVWLFNLLLILFLILNFSYILKPYLFSKISPYSQLGFKTLIIEEKKIFLKNSDSQLLTKGKSFEAKFQAKENNLGIVLLKFNTFGRINKDTLLFRIKEQGSNSWYYEQEYTVGQFQNNSYFTFGFPTINDSKGKIYDIKLTSLSGVQKSSVAISADSPQIAGAYTAENRFSEPGYLVKFAKYKVDYSLRNINEDEWNYVLVIVFSAIFLKLLVSSSSKIRKNFNSLFLQFKKGDLKTQSSKYLINIFSVNKKILIITSLLIFAFAVFFRYASYLNFIDRPGDISLYTRSLGGSTDPDAEILCGLEFARVGGLLTCTYGIVDYIFITPFMGTLMQVFGFIRALELTSFATILVGGVVAVVPFLLFSLVKKRFSVGGFFASLAIIFSHFMILNSSGRILKYNASLLSFSILFVVYFLAVYKKSTKLLILLGIAIAIDSLNKPFHFFNNFPLFFLFPFIFSIDLIKVKRRFPFVFLGKNFILKSKEFWKGTIPFLVAFVILAAYHVFYFHYFKSLWNWIPVITGKIWSNEGDVLAATVAYDGPVIFKITNSLLSVFQGAYIMIGFVQIPFIIFSVVFLAILFKRYSKKTIVLTSISFVLISIFTYLFAHSSFSAATPFPAVTKYTLLQFFEVYLLFYLLFFLAIQSRILFAIVSLQVFYLVDLSLAWASTTQYQLFSTLVFWLIICVGLAIDYLFEDKRIITFVASFFKRKYSVLIFLVALVIAIFLPRLVYYSIDSVESHKKAREEYSYLEWVNKTVPNDGTVIGGIDDNVIWLTRYIQEPILYSAIYNPMYLTMDTPLKNIVRTDMKFLDILQNQSSTNVKDTKLFFLDTGIDKWMNGTWKWMRYFEPDIFTMEVYAENELTGRMIYGLVKNNEASYTLDE